MRRIKREFLALDKGIMYVVKYNSMFYEKLKFGKNYYPTEENQVDHYVEGLPEEYRATVR